MIVEVRDLRELSPALIAIERVLVGKVIAVETVLRCLKGKSANAVSLHTATFFEVVQQARETNPVAWTEPAFVNGKT